MQAKAMAALDKQIAALERERREAERRHSRARGELEARLEEAQERYQREFRAWEDW